MMILIFDLGNMAIIRHFKQWRLNRLEKSVPTLEDFPHVEYSPTQLRLIRRKRFICSNVGHIWEIENIQIDNDYIPFKYNMVCTRCFPHMQSRRSVIAYNLFEPSEKEQI